MSAGAVIPHTAIRGTAPNQWVELVWDYAALPSGATWSSSNTLMPTTAAIENHYPTIVPAINDPAQDGKIL